MSMMKQGLRAIKKTLFGNSLLPQRIFLGQTPPQTETTVWLHGMGSPLDVTYRHSMACADPFAVGIAFDAGQSPSENDRLSLQFRERNGNRQLLGEIGLRQTKTISVTGAEILLFQARSAAIHCLSTRQLWTNYLFHAYADLRSKSRSDINLSFLEKRAMAAMFLCPRSIALATASEEEGGNIFPVNVMGDLDNGYFAFSLKGGKLPSALVERTRRIALSSIPMRQGSIAYQLGAHHNKKFIDWYRLPFETKPSTTFQLPVPVFAYRVREMEVEQVHCIGSHNFFVARVIHDEILDEGQELFVIHGFYHAWRIRKQLTNKAFALAEDALVKQVMSQH